MVRRRHSIDLIGRYEDTPLAGTVVTVRLSYRYAVQQPIKAYGATVQRSKAACRELLHLPHSDYRRAPKACAKNPSNGTMIKPIVKLDRIRAA